MADRDPRIDAYIAKAADFAQPILQRLRDAVHDACPDVEETIKWGSPRSCMPAASFAAWPRSSSTHPLVSGSIRW